MLRQSDLDQLSHPITGDTDSPSSWHDLGLLAVLFLVLFVIPGMLS